jgi:hypothetical protein
MGRHRRGRVFLLAMVPILLLAVYAAAARLGPLPAPEGWPPVSEHAEYSGVVHVHSKYSHDGRGTIDEIARAAARAGTRVVFLTDHNTLAPLTDGKEGWYDSTLILVGAEITTGAGYLLLLNPRADLPVKARGYALDDLISRYRAAGAIVLLAHPDHPRLGWREEMPLIDGIEVIDVFDQVVAAPLHRQLLGLLAYPANPVMAILSIVHWPRRVLDRWDRLASGRPVIGVLGLDAHGGIELTEETGVRFPSHETAFRVGQLHFVSREPLRRDEADRTRVYRAMRAGHFYNAFDGFAPAAGFRFEARSSGGVALMGESIPRGDGVILTVRVPPVGRAVVSFLRDGVVVHRTPAETLLRLPVDAPGVYRIEVDLEVPLFPIGTTRHMPWIFSNPIYVRP